MLSCRWDPRGSPKTGWSAPCGVSGRGGPCGCGSLGQGAARKLRKDVAARQRACDAVAGLLAGRPRITLAEMGVELVRLGDRGPCGGACWAPASLNALLDRVRLAGLVPPGSKWANVLASRPDAKG